MFRFYRMSDRQILENAMDRNRGSSDMGSAMRWESKAKTNRNKRNKQRENIQSKQTNRQKDKQNSSSSLLPQVLST